MTLLLHDCGACHGLTMKRRPGTTLAACADCLEIRRGTWLDAILYGVPGTPMPPWGFEIAPEEAVMAGATAEGRAVGWELIVAWLALAAALVLPGLDADPGG